MTALQILTSIAVFNNKNDESSASLCSTLTVEDIPKKPSHHESEDSARVSFNLDCNVEYDSEPIDDEDIFAIWYTKQDYKEMKKAFVGLGRQFAQYDRTLSDDLSFKAMLQKCFQACLEASEDHMTCSLEKKEEKALRDWLKKGSRRGLERVSVLSIYADKANRRKKVTTALLKAQNESINLDADARAERLRTVSREITRPSRHFARRLAY